MTRDVGAEIWFAGFHVAVKSVTYDPVESRLTVDSTFENLAIADTSRGGLQIGVNVGGVDMGANSSWPQVPAGAGPVPDPYTISVPADFDIDQAVLYFGRPSEHRATVALGPAGEVITEAPVPIIVSGTLKMGYGASYAVKRAELVPWGCHASSEHMEYVAAPKAEWSLVIWGDYRTTQAPVGGLAFNGAAHGYTRLLLPDGSVLEATSFSGTVWGPNQRELNTPTCISGLVAPLSGRYELRIKDDEAPIGKLTIDVP